MAHRITFLPMNIVCESDGRETVFQAAVKNGLNIRGDCGGAGVCGKCSLYIAGVGERLACRTPVDRDMTVRLFEAAGGGGPNGVTAAALPRGFAADRADRFRGRVGPNFGAALDIGTTTVAGMLWNLDTAEPAGALALDNPQAVYGADIISRISFTSENDGNLKTLQNAIISCVNEIITSLCGSAGIPREYIREIAAAGNTAMSHIFLGADPSGLARAPFAPAYAGTARVRASRLGINIDPAADAILLPNIAGHVGGDMTAVLLYTGLRRLKGVNMAVDIGTNGEVMLCGKGRALACSAAAGPAFEGASVKMGMRAREGAISGVRFAGGGADPEIQAGIRLDVIGAGIPTGVCGSGLIAAVAQMLSFGVIDRSGMLLSREAYLAAGGGEALAGRIRRGDGCAEFVLYRCAGAGQRDVVITQRDIRQVQLAKGAIMAGINILLRELSVTARDLDSVTLAGAFGSHIDKRAAVAVGLLPDIPLERVISAGNAAGGGASMALLSGGALREAEELAAGVEHIELSAHPGFQDEFIGCMGF